jgi:hypothetical protein
MIYSSFVVLHTEFLKRRLFLRNRGNGENVYYCKVETTCGLYYLRKLKSAVIYKTTCNGRSVFCANVNNFINSTYV